MSGGQRARLSLARACYSDADVILLDDPLSAVRTISYKTQTRCLAPSIGCSRPARCSADSHTKPDALPHQSIRFCLCLLCVPVCACLGGCPRGGASVAAPVGGGVGTQDCAAHYQPALPPDTPTRQPDHRAAAGHSRTGQVERQKSGGRGEHQGRLGIARHATRPGTVTSRTHVDVLVEAHRMK